MGIDLALIGFDVVDVILVSILTILIVATTSWADLMRWWRTVTGDSVTHDDFPRGVTMLQRQQSWAIGLVIAFPLTLFFTQSLLATLVMAILPTWLISNMICRRYRNVRQSRLDDQTVSFVGQLQQTVAGGVPVFSALGATASTPPQPLRDELEWLVSRLYTVGSVQALQELEQRTESKYLKQVARLLRNSEGLSRVAVCARLDKLHKSFLTVMELRQNIRSMVAQSRYGQYVVMALIPIMIIVNSIINPDSAKILFTENIGRLLLFLVMVDEAAVFYFSNKLLAEVDFDF
jgi:Flp pilus assembly protein TadB